MRAFFLIGFTLVLMNGCSNYSVIVKAHQNDMVESKVRPIENATPISKKTFAINSVEIDPKAMPNEVEFNKTKSFVLPLIVYDYWNHETQYVLGKAQFKTAIEEHLKNAFEVGLSQYGYRKSDIKPDFEIQIKARKINSNALYSKGGFFYFALFFYGWGYHDTRGPYESNLVFEITTTNGTSQYTSEIEGHCFLDKAYFHDDIDPEIERINRSLEISINEAIGKYVLVAPK